MASAPGSHPGRSSAAGSPVAGGSAAGARATETFADLPTSASAPASASPTSTTTVEDSRRIATILIRCQRLSARMPGQPVGTIGADAGRELNVQQQPSGGAELGEVRQHAPVHEQVAVARGLRVTLRGGEQAFWLFDGPDQRRDAGC